MDCEIHDDGLYVTKDSVRYMIVERYITSEMLYWVLGAVAFVAVIVIVAIVKWKSGWKLRKGKNGEKMVADELKRLKRKDTIVFNDVILPTSTGRTSQIDHIVLSTHGVFVIETKSHAGGVYGSEHSQYWTQCLGSQRRRVYNPLLQNNAHLRTLQRILTDVDKQLFTSMIVFTEASRVSVKADDIVIPRSILPDRHIRRTFIPSERRKRRWWWPWGEVRLDEANIVTPLNGLVAEINRRPKVLDRDEIREIADAIAEKALTGKDAERMHTAYAKDTAKQVNRSIRQGNCPRCGSWLVVMKGDRGEFLSCSNYPQCRFTSRLDP